MEQAEGIFDKVHILSLITVTVVVLADVFFLIY